MLKDGAKVELININTELIDCNLQECYFLSLGILFEMTSDSLRLLSLSRFGIDAKERVVVKANKLQLTNLIEASVALAADDQNAAVGRLVALIDQHGVDVIAVAGLQLVALATVLLDQLGPALQQHVGQRLLQQADRARIHHSSTKRMHHQIAQ